MLSGRQIRGLTVYAGCPQQAIGRVTDLVADAASGAVRGLVVASNSWGRSLYLPAEQIRSLGLDGVTVAERGALQKASPPAPGLGKLELRGRPLLGADGTPAGVIADYVADGRRLLGFEISHGLAQDLRRGRDFLSWQEFRTNNLL